MSPAPSRTATDRTTAARAAAAAVIDPELPVLTLDDLGVLRDVRIDPDDPAAVIVTITPTYSGCPAIVEMGADLRSALTAAGFARVEVRTVLAPPWTTDWITAAGRAKLAHHGIAPPGRVGPRTGPVPLDLGGLPARVRCPRCRSSDTEELSRFGPTACTALRRCRTCREPFEHMKEL